MFIPALTHSRDPFDVFISELFRGTEGFYNPVTEPTLFTDTGGTVEVENYGDTIAHADLGYEGVSDAEQATAPARPRFGRLPKGVGRTNRLTHSEDFGNAAWSRTSTTVEQDGEWWDLFEFNSTSAHILQRISEVPVGTHTAYVEIDAGTRTYAILSFSLEASVGINLTTGAVVETTGTATDVLVTPLDTGWGVSFTATIASVCNFNLYTSLDGILANRSYLGSLENGIRIRLAQLNDGDELLPYQKVTDVWDVTQEGIADLPIIWGDGGDDTLKGSIPETDYSTTGMCLYGIMRHNTGAVGLTQSLFALGNNSDNAPFFQIQYRAVVNKVCLVWAGDILEGPAIDANIHVFIAYLDPITQQQVLRIDGVQYTAGITLTATILNKFSLFCLSRITDINFTQASLSKPGIMLRAPTAAEIARIENHLAQIAGVTLP